jgi:hypothetical protein
VCILLACSFIPGLTSTELPVCLAATEERAGRLHEIKEYYEYADDYDDDYYIGSIIDGGNDSEFN